MPQAELLHVVEAQFKQTTVLSIAHRLNFIRDSEYLPGCNTSACSRVNCVPNTFQSRSDPSTGWHRRRWRNGTANQYYDLC